MNYRPQSGVDARTSNAQMAARIMEMPVQPYKEGGFVYRVAEIKGRKSGDLIQVPIAVTMVTGKLYLVSPTSARPWVLNLLADNHCTTVAGSERTLYHAERITGIEAVTVLRTYMSQLQWARQNFPFPADASESQMLDNLDKAAVFCVNPDFV